MLPWVRWPVIRVGSKRLTSQVWTSDRTLGHVVSQQKLKIFSSAVLFAWGGNKHVCVTGVTGWVQTLLYIDFLGDWGYWRRHLSLKEKKTLYDGLRAPGNWERGAVLWSELFTGYHKPCGGLWFNFPMGIPAKQLLFTVFDLKQLTFSQVAWIWNCFRGDAASLHSGMES